MVVRIAATPNVIKNTNFHWSKLDWIYPKLVRLPGFKSYSTSIQFLTSGVIKPMKVGTAIPVNAPIPFVTAIIDPA